jgi:hypothetical protein
MPKLSPQTRFLLRGSALVIGMLSLWWFLLVGPMLVLLRIAASPFLNIEALPSGNWTLNVPLERTLPATPQQPVVQQIHSIDFDMARADAIAFTFSLPVFWALILAAPGLRRSLRPFLFGTALMGGIELALLFAFAQIAARNAVAQVVGIDDATGKWLRHLGEYLIENVLPYATPFVLALALHPALRDAIFALAPAVAPAPPGNASPGAVAKKKTG